QHRDALALGDLVEQDVGARGLHRVLARRLAVLLPVDSDLARVDALVGEAAREALGARGHVPLDERLGHLEAGLRDERVDERRLHVAVAAPLLRGRELLADAVLELRQAPELAEVLRELVVALGDHLLLYALERDGVADRLAGDRGRRLLAPLDL